VRWRPLPSRTSGQALVEFAFASVFFLSIVFGTIDFGWVIFTYSQLHNAVREGARYAKVHCPDTAENRDDVRDVVIDKSPQLGLDYAAVDVQTFGCVPPTGYLHVSAIAYFSAITQEFLGISPITLTSSARVDVE